MINKISDYNVTDLNSPVTEPGVLDGCKIYMVVNPIHESNIDRWELPNPSGFSEDEIAEINRWVRNGGSLFLVADHMPFAGAAKDLAASFGFQFRNGFGMLVKEPNQLDVFSIENERLLESPVCGHEIISLTSYTGSAFRYPGQAVPVMVFKEGDFSLEPEIAWRFREDTKRVELAGHAQGALMDYGAGKLAIFGEAAMFTAQTITTEQGTFKIGLNNQGSAPQNLSFLLNVVHWL